MTEIELTEKIEDIGGYDRDELDDEEADDTLGDLLDIEAMRDLITWLVAETGCQLLSSSLRDMTIKELHSHL